MVWQRGDRLNYEDFLEKNKIVLVFFLFLFIFLSVRLFYLQIIKGNYYTNLSDQQHTSVILERAPRGEIYDSNGELIVRNITTFVVLYYPFTQSRIPTKEIIGQLEKILKKRITVDIGSGFKVVKLVDNLSRNELFKIQEKRLSIPSISVLEEAKRESINREATSHLIGYLSEVSPRELENIEFEGYRAGDFLGRGGLEQEYDIDLRGQDGGWQIEVDALGRQTKMLRHIPSLKGNSLYTTIDSSLQKVAYDALRKSTTGRGAVVAIDPRSGAVKALVSSPGFNPDFSTAKEFLDLLKDKDLPLFNRAVQAVYSPGSVFKIITFIGAVANNTISPQQKYTCTGSFTLGNQKFACWKASGHGQMSLIPAMAESCNVYFYNIGLEIGQKVIENYAKMFRIGERTEIDLPSEKKGLLPSSEWKLRRRNKPWLKGDTVNISIGQGSLLVTPLQIASMISTVANEGIIYRPYIVEKIVDSEGNVLDEHKTAVNGKVDLHETTWLLLKKALENVVTNGTGKGCYFPEIKIAGKTGTAQNPQGESHAWFASYAPADNPEIALTVFIENGGSGGHEAVPVARKIYQEYFKIKERNSNFELGEEIPAADEVIISTAAGT